MACMECAHAYHLNASAPDRLYGVQQSMQWHAYTCSATVCAQPHNAARPQFFFAPAGGGGAWNIQYKAPCAAALCDQHVLQAVRPPTSK
jgi:hypothetical protein